MKPIENWRQAWRMVSVQLMTAAAVLQVLWTEYPEAVRAVVPPTWVPYITVGLLALGIVGRLVKQPELHNAP